MEVKAAEPALTELLFGDRPFGARAQAGITLGQIGDRSTAIRLTEFVDREPAASLETDDRSRGSPPCEQGSDVASLASL